MTRITFIDPGKATGWASGYYDDETPFQLSWAAITNGWDETEEFWWETEPGGRLGVERFILRSKAFVPNIEGVQLEGLFRGTWGAQGYTELFWRTPADKGKSGKSSGTSAFDSELKRLGLWQTGKMVGHKDGRDANDCIIHILKLLIHEKHMPTLEAYWPDGI